MQLKVENERLKAEIERLRNRRNSNSSDDSMNTMRDVGVNIDGQNVEKLFIFPASGGAGRYVFVCMCFVF